MWRLVHLFLGSLICGTLTVHSLRSDSSWFLLKLIQELFQWSKVQMDILNLKLDNQLKYFWCWYKSFSLNFLVKVGMPRELNVLSDSN